MKSKPDRFERAVEEAVRRNNGYWLDDKRVAKLLRGHHNWVMRMVRQHKESLRPASNDRSPDAWEAWFHVESVCDGIEVKLAQRRK